MLAFKLGELPFVDPSMNGRVQANHGPLHEWPCPGGGAVQRPSLDIPSLWTLHKQVVPVCGVLMIDVFLFKTTKHHELIEGLLKIDVINCYNANF